MTPFVDVVLFLLYRRQFPSLSIDSACVYQFEIFTAFIAKWKKSAHRCAFNMRFKLVLIMIFVWWNVSDAHVSSHSVIPSDSISFLSVCLLAFTFILPSPFCSARLRSSLWLNRNVAQYWMCACAIWYRHRFILIQHSHADFVKANRTVHWLFELLREHECAFTMDAAWILFGASVINPKRSRHYTVAIRRNAY